MGKVRAGLQQTRKILSGLTALDWVMINFKISMGFVWPIAFSFASPEALTRNLGLVFLGFWMTAAAVGMVVSMTGLVMSAQSGMTRLRGFRIELVGLFIFAAGPLVYFAAQIGILIQEPTPVRLAQIALSYALCCAILVRILIVRAGAKKALGTEEDS